MNNLEKHDLANLLATKYPVADGFSAFFEYFGLIIYCVGFLFFFKHLFTSLCNKVRSKMKEVLRGNDESKKIECD